MTTQSQPPAAGEAAHTPKNPGAMNDSELPQSIPPGFFQLNANGGGGARREAGDIEWNAYKKRWQAAYKAGSGYAVGNTSIVARPSPEVALALNAISCNSHAALVEALTEIADQTGCKWTQQRARAARKLAQSPGLLP